MSAHTPGPWAVWIGEGYDDSIAIAGNPTGSLGGMRKLALINLDYKPSRDSIDRANADARLIAAAPELLEALRIAVRQNSHDMLLTGEELRACEAAIAKAVQE